MSRDSILIDAGPMVAIFALNDAARQICSQQLREIKAPLLTCWPVVSEAAWLLKNYSQGTSSLLKAIDGKRIGLLDLAIEDVPSVSEILAKYRDLGLQLADAALLHLANREGIDTIFTLDRRDFGVVRKSTGKKLRVIP